MLEEKYRPERLNQIVGQEQVIQKIQNHMDKKPEDIPHFLFHGDSGIGKTATAVAMANELDASLIELNASNDRGVDIIRNKVIPAMRHNFGGHKIIFMDEADMLTEESQRALRRPLEKFHKATVIMTGNNIDGINAAIKDRMNVYEFKRINKNAMIERLQYIAGEEGITTADYDDIFEQSFGSMRKAIKLLEDYESDTHIVDDEVKEMAEQMGL